MNRTVFRVEATVLALPTVAFALWAIPNVVLWVVAEFAAMSNSSATLYEVAVVPAILVLGLFALSVVGRLVVATAMGRTFRFGIVFWLGLACGLLLAAYLYLISSLQVALVIVGPLLFLAAHASFIQRHEPQQGVPGDVAASRRRA